MSNVVHLAWTPTHTSGAPILPGDIVSYALGEQVAGAPSFTTIPGPVPPATTLDVTVTDPGTYNFQLVATDKVGTVSAPVTASVTIAAPPPPPPPPDPLVLTSFTATLPPPPGLSPLETIIAGLSAGAFETYTMPSVMNISNAAGSSVMEYVVRGLWDNAHKKIKFVGISHALGWAQYGEFDLSTGVWSQELIPDGRTDPRHAYSGTSYDSVNGCTLYHEGNGGATLWKRTNAGVWTSYTNPQHGWAQTEFHPGLGKLVIGQVWGIRTFDAANNTFAVLRNNSAGTDMSDSTGVSAYSPKDGCVYVGNDNPTGANNGKTWKVSAASICTQIAHCPDTLYLQSAGNNTSMLLGSGNPTNKLLSFRQDAQTREYDEIADSWSAPLALDPGFVSFIQGAVNNQWFAVSLVGLGALAFIRQTTNDAMDHTMYIWKR
jgi:hypothetical protein